MAQTYAQLQRQIAKLQSEAEKLRNDEMTAVIAKMRADIRDFGISAQDLFGKVFGKPKKSKSKLNTEAKYADGQGNMWVGRGPRPKWLREALAAGRRLEEFVFGAPAAKAAAPAAKKAARKTAPAKKAATKKRAAAPKKPEASA